MKVFKCYFCLYFSDRKYNLQKHINRKHNQESVIIENKSNVQNDILNVQNDILNVQNDIPNVQNDIPNQHICKTCQKSYKTKRHLIKHEKICNKVDNLTCPKCMLSFTHRNNRNRHIKANKCDARSIIHARQTNIQNITNNGTFQNAETIQNISNNIYINNFGSERIDHISEDDIKKILQNGINTIPLYIEKKHFDKNFPENKNIQYTDDNKCKIMENNMWKEKDIGLLSTDLIKDNSEVLLMYCDNNEIKLLQEIKDTEKYDHIRNKLFIIYNKSDNKKYNQVLKKIKDLIKNSNKENYFI